MVGIVVTVAALSYVVRSDVPRLSLTEPRLRKTSPIIDPFLLDLQERTFRFFWDTTNAANGRSDVRGLVYTAAYVPESGETITSLSAGYAPGAFLAHLLFAPALPFVIVDPQFFPEDFAQDLNPKLGAEIAAQQRPTSLGLFVTPSGPAAWHALPSWYAVSAHDRAIDPALQRFMAQRAGSTTVEFAAASQVGGL